MKDPDLTYCLRKAQDAYFHLLRAGDAIAMIGGDEGGHYLDNTLKYIWHAKDMLNRYREFIKEDGDEESICRDCGLGSGVDDSGSNTIGMHEC